MVVSSAFWRDWSLAPSRSAAFGLVAQAGQRRLEIVGDIVGDFLQALQQLLDAVEHGVEIGGEPIEFVIAPGERHALGEVAGHDLGGGIADGVDAAQHPPRGDAAGDHGEQDDADDADEEALHDDGRKPRRSTTSRPTTRRMPLSSCTERTTAKPGRGGRSSSAPSSSGLAGW